MSRTLRTLLSSFCLAASCAPAAAEFALAVSPPRLELKAKAGDTVRQVIELTQAGARSGTYRFKTADWTLGPDAGVAFIDELAPGSCRPWVSIERREAALAPGRPYRYRLEISVPPDTPAMECRFALLVEGQEASTNAALPFGLSGRIGVIVYLAIGDAQPQLSAVGATVVRINGLASPLLRIRNDGLAHGRLAGFLNGTDAAGNSLEITAATTPILPGESRDIALSASKPSNPDVSVPIQFPLKVRGKLEWGTRGSTDIDLTFAP